MFILLQSRYNFGRLSLACRSSSSSSPHIRKYRLIVQRKPLPTAPMRTGAFSVMAEQMNAPFDRVRKHVSKDEARVPLGLWSGFQGSISARSAGQPRTELQPE